MSRIFLSHSSKNNAQALALRDWLAANGWGRDDIFLDIDTDSGIAPGERWQRALNEAASRCEAVVFLISGDWLASRWCHEELALAHKLNKRLFGIMIDTVKLADVPTRLAGEWQLIDLESARDGIRIDVEHPDGTQGFATFSRSGLNRFKAGLHKAGLDPRFFVWPPPEEPDRAPYRGLAPMEAGDAGIFYGREAATIDALDRIRGLTEAAAPRLMAILGASGAGKSSFMRAGIIPRMRRDDSNFLVLPVLRPERAALSGPAGLSSGLAGAAQELGLNAWTRSRTAKAIVAGPNDVAAMLAELAAAAARQAGSPAGALHPSIVLPLEQAEELFVAEGRDEAQEFLALLSSLLQHRTLRLIALATIRTDSYEMLQLAPQLTGIDQLPFSLPALARGAYQRVIEGPSERLAGTGRALRIEPALTAALMRDIEEGGAKDALPLLAFTLERLYIEHGSDGDLTLAEYMDSGGISGAIEAAVERALAAADADPGVPRDRQAKLALLKRAMIPWLASIDPETKTPRRQVARFSDIPDEARPLIERFVDQHLLSTDLAGGERTIEPAHEALLRQWGQIDTWLKDDIAVLATLEGVRRAARDWHMNRDNANWLAHRGGRLDDAEAVRSRADLARRFDQTDLAYLEACRAAETAHRDRELSEARKLAEAQKIAADRLKQVAHRNRIGAVAAVVLAIAAAGIGFQGQRLAAQATQQAKAAVEATARATDATRRAEAESQRAEGERAKAEQNAALAAEKEEQALVQLRRAQLSQSTALVEQARQAILDGRPLDGMVMALEALPENPNIPEKPFLLGAEHELARALLANRLKLVLAPTDDRINNTAISADGSLIATGNRDGRLVIYETKDGAQLGAYDDRRGSILATAFSSDGALVATSHADPSSILVRDSRTGAIKAELRDDNGFAPTEVYFVSSDEQLLTMNLFSTGAKIWNLATGRVALSLNEPERGFGAKRLSISSDGRYLASIVGLRSATFYTWRSDNPDVYLTDVAPDNAEERAELVLPTKRASAVDTGTDGSIDDEDFSNEADAESFGAASFIPSTGDLVLVGKQSLYVVNMDQRSVVRSWSYADEWQPIATKFLRVSDGGQLAVLNVSDRELEIHDVVAGRKVRTLTSPVNVTEVSAITVDGRLVAAAATDNSIVVWNTKSGQVETILRGHVDGVHLLAFIEGGARLVSAGHDKIRIWDPRPEPERHGLPAFPYGWTIAKVDGKGQYAFLSETVVDEYASPPRFAVWRASDGKIIRTIDSRPGLTVDQANVLFPNSGQTIMVPRRYDPQVQEDAVMRAERTRLSERVPRSEQAVAPGAYTAVEFVDLGSGETTGVVQLPIEQGAELHFALSADGTLLAAAAEIYTSSEDEGSYGTYTSRLMVLDVATGEIILQAVEPGEPTSIRISPNAQALILSLDPGDSAGEQISIWSILQNRKVATFEGSISVTEDELTALAKQNRILTGGGDTPPVLRSLTTGAIVGDVMGTTLDTEEVAVNIQQSRLLVVHKDKAVELWDLETRTRIARTAAGGWSSQAAFSDNGLRYLTWNTPDWETGRVHVFESQTGGLLSTFAVGKGSSFDLGMTGRFVGFEAEDVPLEIHTIDKGVPPRRLGKPGEFVRWEFADGDDRLVTVDGAGKVTIRRTADGSLVGSLEGADARSPLANGANGRARMVPILMEGGGAIVLDSRNATVRWRSQSNAGYSRLDMDGGGNTLVLTNGSSVEFLKLESLVLSRAEMNRVELPDFVVFDDAATRVLLLNRSGEAGLFNRDGAVTIATLQNVTTALVSSGSAPALITTSGNTLEIRDMASGAMRHKRELDQNIARIAVDRQRGAVALATEDNKAFTFDLGSGELREVGAFNRAPSLLSFTVREGDLLVQSGSRQLVLRDVESGKDAVQFVGTWPSGPTSGSSPWQIHVDPGGTHVGFLTPDQRMMVHRVADGALTSWFHWGAKDLARMAFLTDGNVFAATDDGSATVWDVHADKSLMTGSLGTQLTRFKGQLVIGPSNEAFVLDEAGKITMMRLATGRRAVYFNGQPEADMAMAVSPDGSLLATASPQFLRVWNVAQGKPVFELPAFEREVTYGSDLRFSDDGGILFVSVGERTEMFAMPAKGEELRRAAEDQLAALKFDRISRQERTDGMRLGVEGGVGTEGLLIRNVVADSAAMQSGIRAGDIVLTFDGKRIATIEDLQIAVHEASADKLVPVRISRAGEVIDLPVLLPNVEAAAPN